MTLNFYPNNEKTKKFAAWEYFSKDLDGKTAQCHVGLLCIEKIAIPNGSTTGLFKHLCI